jgi:protein-S-isoprenylcysteine O-methyltransferase Ste14
MPFRFYSNIISQASRRLAGGMLLTGLALIGFGVLIYVLPRLFATIAAIIFFIAGTGVCVTALKIFAAQRLLNKETDNESKEYRENVRIRIEQH